MNHEAIDSVLLCAPSVDEACRPYERLGLRLSPLREGRRSLHVGGSSDHFTVEFVSPDDPWAASARQPAAPGGLIATVLRVSDLDHALSELNAKGVVAVRLPDQGDQRAAWLPLHDRAGTDVILVQGSRSATDVPTHALPLLRLDHLAAVTHDLDEKTRFWADVLGVPVAGEVSTPAMVIRQLRIGDAVLELLGPASADSPLWKRTPGLVSMASWQVADLDAAVAHARATGFTATDPAAGVLPGTRFATVQGGELAGVNLQLLQYV